VATFVNLGFSEDSGTFMFGQYGVRSEDTRAYAEIYTVDVDKNRFVKGGRVKEVYDTEIEPGQDGKGALFELLHEVAPLAERYRVNHLATGRVVYLLIDGDEPKERLKFRDFYHGDSYVLSLVQQQFGEGANVRSSFHINIAVTDKAGKTETYTLGLPDYTRDGVLSYRIKQVFFSPDERGLVCVVEKHIREEDGKSIRYMVETARLN
jgi:predicted secreted protein